uniref:putative ubiquitin-conjugating enzyme E2Q2-like protein n=1 Tax=Macaca mulatta TaxID=9544 RepID=UPI0010A21EC3|nr:putative ubiquitin-conjugating enzyme E2Q2-like protein [Macaca mulatta]
MGSRLAWRIVLIFQRKKPGGSSGSRPGLPSPEGSGDSCVWLRLSQPCPHTEAGGSRGLDFLPRHEALLRSPVSTINIFLESCSSSSPIWFVDSDEPNLMSVLERLEDTKNNNLNRTTEEVTSKEKEEEMAEGFTVTQAGVQ